MADDETPGPSEELEPQQSEFQPRKPGRPSKLYDGVRIKFVDAVRNGVPPETAAIYAGIGKSTYYSWKARGEQDRILGVTSEYTEFLEAFEQARADDEAKRILSITKAADAGSWQAHAWYLERTQRDKYGRVDKIVVEAEVKMQFAVEMVQLVLGVLEQAVPLEYADIRQAIITGLLVAADDWSGAQASPRLLPAPVIDAEPGEVSE